MKRYVFDLESNGLVHELSPINAVEPRMHLNVARRSLEVAKALGQIRLQQLLDQIPTRPLEMRWKLGFAM